MMKIWSGCFYGTPCTE